MASLNPATPTEPVAPRIVGLGASAGGLSPLEAFFGQVPPDSGMAYIVVQHLDPTQKALLPKLLQRTTAMPVREAGHEMRVEPDCVYVIPSNAELSVIHAKLHLKAPAEPRGQRLPIDVLFSSLARDQGEQSIAVVLSGMGTDGTLGLQAIKAVGGLTAVQQPDTAQFDAMPKSAIAADCADIVAPPAELPECILAYLTRLTALAPEARTKKKTKTETKTKQETTAADTAQSSPEPAPMETVFRVLRERTRHDFSSYKPSTLRRRIDRRLAIHAIPTLEQYADFLHDNTQEVDLLFKELLIGVTHFFRDAAVWDHLAADVVPELLARRSTEHSLRAWVVGCSTGEEAYSLAMVFTEAMQRMAAGHEFSLQIFASDLSPDAISAARRGHYPLSIRDEISEDWLARFFSAHETHYQINKNIRDMVLFAQHDVLLDPPFTRLDLLACRNLMIYLDAGVQRRLMPLFHYSLRPGGVLLLGTSETVGRFNQLFTPINAKLRTYLREDTITAAGLDFPVQPRRPRSATTKEIDVSSSTTPTTTEIPSNLQQAADQVLLQVYAPAAVVVNSQGDIVYISGRTGKYLEPAAGKANWNFHAMVREGLRARLAEALHQAATQKEAVHVHGLKVQTPSGDIQAVDVTVQALQESAALKGMCMVVFRDVAPAPARRGRRKSQSAEQEEDLQQCHDEIQALREQNRTTREELQSANEELVSTNEELQSTNEELQSTNEELSTSKEEMQSMNEELQTINAEMQTKLDDLALAQSDLSNILNSIEIAILFLDQELNVRRYTDRAAKIINLRESDVGRPLSDLTTMLEYPALHDDAVETLRTLATCEKEIHSTDNRWFSVRIMPYRRLDNVIDGVVLTLVDITASKTLESSLRADARPPHRA